MPTMKIHEQITPENWCQGRAAKNGGGREVSIDSHKACRWCAVGWLGKIYGDSLQGVFNLRETIRFKQVNKVKIIDEWNDSSNFEQVKAAFLKADL